MRRPEDAIRAGTVMSFRRIVAVVADRSALPVMVAAVRVRLNAMTARTSQTAFAVNFPEGRCASAECFRSALMLDDRVFAVDLVGGHRVQVRGGEERVEPVRIEQRGVCEVFFCSARECAAPPGAR
jgi:hypothetical protein